MTVLLFLLVPIFLSVSFSAREKPTPKAVGSTFTNILVALYYFVLEMVYEVLSCIIRWFSSLLKKIMRIDWGSIWRFYIKIVKLFIWGVIYIVQMVISVCGRLFYSTIGTIVEIIFKTITKIMF